MFKLALLFSLGAGTVFAAGAAGRVHHSGLQFQIFNGYGLKVTPDPSNIWSFHETVTVPRAGKIRVPVLVDFNGDRRMDTHMNFARVLITDMQVSVDNTEYFDWMKVHLVDDKGARWDLGATFRQRSQAGPYPLAATHHLTTPLALPVDSGLAIEATQGNAPPVSMTIHLIGRFVTL